MILVILDANGVAQVLSKVLFGDKATTLAQLYSKALASRIANAIDTNVLTDSPDDFMLTPISNTHWFLAFIPN